MLLNNALGRLNTTKNLASQVQKRSLAMFVGFQIQLQLILQFIYPSLTLGLEVKLITDHIEAIACTSHKHLHALVELFIGMMADIAWNVAEAHLE